MGRAHARSGGGNNHAGGIPRHRVRGRILVRGRAGERTRLGGVDSVQPEGEGAVRRVLRASGHVLAGRVQRLPADGAAGRGSVREPADGEAAALRTEQVGSLRVALCERACGAQQRDHAAGHGGLHAGRVGGAR